MTDDVADHEAQAAIGEGNGLEPIASDPGVLGALTPAYSSMQVLTGEDPTPADDVFSLGCLMYRMVAGHRVFGPRNAAEAAEQGMEPQRPQALNDAQWRALRKALSGSRAGNLELDWASELTAALERLSQGGVDAVLLDRIELGGRPGPCA